MYIDVHCHLTGDEFLSVGGIDEVIARANADGVTRMICSGFDVDSSQIAKELSERFPEVYFSAGFHPSELKKYRDGDFDRLAELCAHPKCVALGEIGLDYHFDDNPDRAWQQQAFVTQMEMADKLGLPIVVHSRDAAQDTLTVLKQNVRLLKKGGLLHCYSYSAELLPEFISLGFAFSFGGPSTFKNAKKVWESVQRVPAPLLLSETDCPYLTPVPFRGEFPNQPKNVVPIVKNMAVLRNENEEDLKQQIFANAKRLFFKLN